MSLRHLRYGASRESLSVNGMSVMSLDDFNINLSYLVMKLLSILQNDDKILLRTILRYH